MVVVVVSPGRMALVSVATNTDCLSTDSGTSGAKAAGTWPSLVSHSPAASVAYDPSEPSSGPAADTSKSARLEGG